MIFETHSNLRPRLTDSESPNDKLEEVKKNENRKKETILLSRELVYIIQQLNSLSTDSLSIKTFLLSVLKRFLLNSFSLNPILKLLCVLSPKLGIPLPSITAGFAPSQQHQNGLALPLPLTKPPQWTGRALESRHAESCSHDGLPLRTPTIAVDRTARPLLSLPATVY